MLMETQAFLFGMDIVDAGMNNIFGSKKKKTYNEEKQVRQSKTGESC